MYIDRAVHEPSRAEFWSNRAELFFPDEPSRAFLTNKKFVQARTRQQTRRTRASIEQKRVESSRPNTSLNEPSRVEHELKRA